MFMPRFLRTSYFWWQSLGLRMEDWATLAAQEEFQGASLAIVGNAGYLGEINQGSAIQRHDLVLRMNNFQTVGFERQVGSRTDLFFTNFYRDVELVRPELRKARWLIASVPGNFRKSHSLPLNDRHGEEIVAGLIKMQRTRVYMPSLSVFQQRRAAIGKYPTTGNMAICFALDYLLTHCSSIYITGFSFFTGRSHYFSDRPQTPLNHDMERERILLAASLQGPRMSGKVRVDDRMAAQLDGIATREDAA